MLECQKAYKAAMARGKTPEATEAAKKVDKASHAELNRMRALPCNAECFDCTALKPGWAVLPHGVFVCIDCAQVHRNLGRHISQTKAINTGTYLWYPHELQVMRAIGNGRALAAMRGAPKKPSRDAPAAEKEAYARAKYEERRWGPFYTEQAEVAPDPMVKPAFVKPPSSSAVTAASTTKLGNTPPKTMKVQAKRLAPVCTQSLVGDLITLDTWEQPQQPPIKAPSPVSFIAELQADNWAVWEEAPSQEGSSKWDTKKAAVLAQFSNGTNTTPPMHNPALFFAQYGL